MPLQKMDQDFCETVVISRLLNLTPEFDVVSDYCCGQFVVRKDRFNHTAFDTWNSVLDFIANMRMFSFCGSPESQLRVGFTLEMLYHTMFGEPAIPPIREEDISLPLYLKVMREFEHSVFPSVPSFGDSFGSDFQNVVY